MRIYLSDLEIEPDYSDCWEYRINRQTVEFERRTGKLLSAIEYGQAELIEEGGLRLFVTLFTDNEEVVLTFDVPKGAWKWAEEVVN